MKKYILCYFLVLFSSFVARADVLYSSSLPKIKVSYSEPSMSLRGMEMWYAPLLGSGDKKACNKKRLAAELDSLRALGVNTVSVLAGAQFTPMPTDTVNLTKGKLASMSTDAHILRGLGYVLGELARRQMTAIVVLVRHWDDASQAAQHEERYVENLALLTNPVTHQPLLSDPTIRFWQMSDAPMLKQQTEVLSYVEWATSQAQQMRNRGFKQPLSVAYMPSSPQPDATEQTLQNLMSRDCIDNVALSLNPLALGWLTPGELYSGLGKVYLRATDLLQTALRTAKAYDKTFYLTDCAYPRLAMFTRPGTNTEPRDNFFSFLFSTYADLTENEASSPFLGLVVKGWGGLVRPTDDQWKVPYDFTAEYPDEAKGRYSVFTNDGATLKVLREGMVGGQVSNLPK